MDNSQSILNQQKIRGGSRFLFLSHNSISQKQEGDLESDQFNFQKHLESSEKCTIIPVTCR